MKVKAVVASIIFLALVSFCRDTFAAAGQNRASRVIFFYSASCHKCLEIENDFIPQLKKDFGSAVEIQLRDIAVLDNYKLLLALKDKFGNDKDFSVPVIFFDGNFLVGTKEIRSRLYGLIENPSGSYVSAEGYQKEGLVSNFKSITPIAVAGSGLVDGINPCAFTVIVFFVSFLAVQGYRRRELLIVGVFFILTVFISYVLIGLGIFGFLYRISGFWMVSRAVNLVIGLLSVLLGILCIYDLFRFKITDDAKSMLLQLPNSVKKRIHALIGSHYRVSEGRGRKNIFAVAASAVVTGFLISVLEAVCTGQLYLPTITFVLKTTELKFRAFLLLILYNLMFIVPLFAVFVLALAGVNSQRLAAFFRRKLLTVKALMAAVFIGLGAFLIWWA